MSTIAATSQNPINQINPITGKVGAASSAATASSGSSSTSSTAGLATESTFLSLLVAQLKNQDPEQPADGTQFVTQLAQFTTLEQNLAMRTDLDSINKNTTAISATASGSKSTPVGGA